MRSGRTFVMDRVGLLSWVRAYETAWRSDGIAALSALFTDDVRYSRSPWAVPLGGLAELASFWEAERDGPGEDFAISASVVAVDGDVGVVRVEVRYGDRSQWRDLWVVRFADDGRCSEFEEWPFAPRQRDGH